jgi:single-strand DNA-binding protein
MSAAMSGAKSAAKSTGKSAASSASGTDPEPWVNEVRLRGRVSGVPVERELPSGDVVITWRLVVPRGAGGADTLDCAAWSASTRRAALRLRDGDVAELSGRLRRRFWRSPTGPASRYEVEVLSASRVRE